MKYFPAIALFVTLDVTAQQTQTAYGQCGGTGFTGPTSCVCGNACTSVNPYYYQCTPTPVPQGVQSIYGQCAGIGYTGLSTCACGSYCYSVNAYYYQCTPGVASATSTPILTSTTVVTTKTTSSSTKISTTLTTSTSTPSTTITSNAISTSSSSISTTLITSTVSPSTSKSSSSSTTSTSSAASSSTTKVKYAGINIAGFDFGCGTDGTCNGGIVPPGTAGNGQMNHFVNDDKLNAFRLPVGWQTLTNSLGGPLTQSTFSQYDLLVQGCTASGAAMCIIDVHNYARWNGGIIGQGGPTNAQFASLWSLLATYYKSNSKVVFGIMNEPHDLNINTWAITVQAVVTAIRLTGATNLILLPSTDWTGGTNFISSGSAAALLTVTNPDSTTTGLIFDIHQYFDSDGSGSHTNCVTNHISDAFSPMATWLRTNGRLAFLSETGGGSSDPTCLSYVCQALQYLDQNSDVFLGYTGWAAGSFDSSYILSMTPFLSGTTYTDQQLVSQCLVAAF